MSKHSRSKTVWRVTLAVVSVLVIGGCVCGISSDMDSCRFAGDATLVRVSYGQPPPAGNVLPCANDDCRYRCVW